MYGLKQKNALAEVIKNFIDATWRGYQVRASMKAFLHQVKVVQKAFRTSFKLRRFIRTYIYLPAVWEAETAILGGVVGIPKQALRLELEHHRTCWDLKARCREAQKMSDKRANTCGQ